MTITIMVCFLKFPELNRSKVFMGLCRINTIFTRLYIMNMISFKFKYAALLSVLLLFAVSTSQAQSYYLAGANSWNLPPLPQTLDFAGERVPLENYDTKESLQRELITTGYMHTRTFLTMLNTRRYVSVIAPILQKNGIPYDFIYLCMAESGLDPNAVSSANAGGIWQFMQATGKGYGLIVESGVDERYHIEKSTEAACKYLKEAYDRFGSWTFAAAAYNLGSAGLARRIEKQGTDNYYDTFLPAETLRYMFRILSFKLITQAPATYGFIINEADLYPPLTNYTVVQVNDANIVWSDVARRYGTNYKMLRQLNQWIRDYEYNNKAGRTFDVKIPGEGFRLEKQN